MEQTSQWHLYSSASSLFDKTTLSYDYVGIVRRSGLMVSALDSGANGPGSSPDARFISKAPETFRARKTVAKSRTLRLPSCFIHVFLI